MNSLKDNRVLTEVIRKIFLLFIIFKGISTFLRLSNFSSIEYQYAIEYIFFFMSVITYLVWYNNINHNFEVITNQKNPEKINWSFLDWIFPIANILLPFKKFKKIIVAYSKKSTKTSGTKKWLNIWAIAFLIWYIVSTYQFFTLPLFPEDIPMFYAMNPMRELFDEISIAMVQIIGLFSMTKIMEDIYLLEKKMQKQG